MRRRWRWSRAANPESRLADHVTRELNRPFERPRCKPWRFSVLEAEPDAHYVIVTYDHWVADSTAARLVLRHVLDRYCGWNLPENRRPLDLYPGTYREVFAHRLGGARLFGAGMHSLRPVDAEPIRGASSVLVQPTDGHSFRALSRGFRHGPRLRHFARSLGATIHDVILAALGRAMAEFLPRRAMRKRQELSLGTIVDARADAQEDLSDSLGAFLGLLSRAIGRRQGHEPGRSRSAASPPQPVRSRRGGRISIRC